MLFLDILTEPDYVAMLNPKQQVAFLKLLTKIIAKNNNLLIQIVIFSEENPPANRILEAIIAEQNSQLEKLCKKITLWINRIIYKDYYRMNEVEEHCGISWRNIERYSKKGYVERVKIGREIKISSEQAQKALFILNCKKILTIPNQAALQMYENEAQRKYCEAKFLITTTNL